MLRPFPECHGPMMKASHLVNGEAAEALAARYLERRGLKVIERNYRVKGGEIDLVCEDGRTLVFVEVRLRSNRHFGSAADSITRRKQQRIVLAAQHWLQRHGERACRFDCIAMDAADEARIEWIRDAFTTD